MSAGINQVQIKSERRRDIDAGSASASDDPDALRRQILDLTRSYYAARWPEKTFVAGQSWFEPPGAIHLFAENASTTEPAQILATFVADDDCGLLTIPD